jgi:hypothetical protein
MTGTQLTPPAARPLAAVGPFVRHYLEMVVAMVVGMVALHPVASAAFAAVGRSALHERADVGAMVMATTMTVAMAAWMRLRGHRWRATAEMAAAMVVPFAVLLVPLWAGAISASTLMLAGHVLMLLAMAAAMLARPGEYAHAHSRHG